MVKKTSKVMPVSSKPKKRPAGVVLEKMGGGFTFGAFESLKVECWGV